MDAYYRVFLNLILMYNSIGLYPGKMDKFKGIAHGLWSFRLTYVMHSLDNNADSLGLFRREMIDRR